MTKPKKRLTKPRKYSQSIVPEEPQKPNRDKIVLVVGLLLGLVVFIVIALILLNQLNSQPSSYHIDRYEPTIEDIAATPQEMVMIDSTGLPPFPFTNKDGSTNWPFIGILVIVFLIFFKPKRGYF